ncbi:hypothetical protein JCM6882_007256 [Rhodosporidiobolus microsporus]
MSTTVTKPLPALPHELWLEVMKHLDEEFGLDWRPRSQTFARCRLVSRSWNSLARPFLFTKVDLTTRDLLSPTPLFRLLEAGDHTLVRHLRMSADIVHDFEGAVREPVFDLLSACSGLESLFTNQLFDFDDVQYMFATCLPRWSNITALSIRRASIDGDPLLSLTSLTSLSVAAIAFSMSLRKGPPPAFRLHTLHINDLELMVIQDFTFLTSSSTSTLQTLELELISSVDDIDLSPFSKLADLSLIFASDDPDGEVRRLVSILASAPRTVTSLTVGLYNENTAPGDIFAEQGFFEAIPAGVKNLILCDVWALPIFPSSYLNATFLNPALLPKLEYIRLPIVLMGNREQEKARDMCYEGLARTRPHVQVYCDFPTRYNLDPDYRL